MQDAALLGSARNRGFGRRWSMRIQEFLPRGNTLDDTEWHRRHRLLGWVLLLHVPLLVGIGLALDHTPASVAIAVVAPLVCLLLGHLVGHRRWAQWPCLKLI